MEEKELLEILEHDTGIKFKTCDSSNIICYGYDKSENNLWIVFKGNKVYKYLNISKQQYKELEEAESKGKWVNANIVKPKVNFEAYVLE